MHKSHVCNFLLLFQELCAIAILQLGSRSESQLQLGLPGCMPCGGGACPVLSLAQPPPPPSSLSIVRGVAPPRYLAMSCESCMGQSQCVGLVTCGMGMRGLIVTGHGSRVMWVM